MWKSNWEQTKRRFIRWWNHEGLLIGGLAPAASQPHAEVAPPGRPRSLEERYCDPEFRAAENNYRLSRSAYPLDLLPIATTNIGPGSLALFLGARAGFAEDTVWYHPNIADEAEPEKLPPMQFDPGHPWWLKSMEIVDRCIELGRGKYIVGCPDLIENVDVLASLRGSETLLMDMMERPEWVEQKVREINEVWFAAYARIYDRIKLEDGSSSFGPFMIWGPGKVAKLQCDMSATFSPAMYRRFILPALTAQCAWLDHSLYHLDGTQAMIHLDSLLSIEQLDAIEWTPQAGIETGGNRRWYDLYRRILAAGKSVQVLVARPEELIPLLDAIGPKGVYALLPFTDERQTEALGREVERRFGAVYS